MYSIEFSKLALKQLKKLDHDIQKRCIAAIERCKVRPYAHVRKLVASPYYRLRIGSYRAILKIHDGKLIILVIKIAHRKKIYN